MARDFDEFFRTTYLATVRGLERDGTPGDLAHDAAQEAYVRAYARWWRVGHYREPVAWVRRVAVNLVRDEHRRRRRGEALVARLAEGVGGVTAPAADVEAEVADGSGFDETLRALPAQQRRAVDLYYRAGCSTEEGARRMGISSGAFRFHLSRARRNLEPRLLARLGTTEAVR